VRNGEKQGAMKLETQRLKNIVAARMTDAAERIAPETSSGRARTRAHGRPATPSRARKSGTTQAPSARGDDYAASSRFKIEPSIRRALFFDFLDMAASLLEESDRLSAATSAAFLAGATFEEYLRKLAEANGIETVGLDGERVGAESLNAELCGEGVYDLTEQMQATAWLDLRNKAYLGKRHEFTAEEVRLMIQGVREFMSRHRE
jgi:hypothetical protein